MPNKELRLLALDGGGVRGLSALIILKQLMETIHPDSPLKPCEYFDMIGGTSTGGLIAIMLGRLKMGIDECIGAYLSLSDGVFQKKRHRVTTKGNIQGRFDSEELERAVKEVVTKQGLRMDALLKDGPEATCRVFVCATSKETSETVCLTSYTSPHGDSDLLNSVKIWEACRATSAASSFFDPIALGQYHEEFVDGATGANNPVWELWNQAQLIWGPEPLEKKVKCLISIGTGVPSLNSFRDDVFHIGETLVAIATETEQTAEKFCRDKLHLDSSGWYYRFNVIRGLENVGLEESKKTKEIAAATRRYVGSHDVFKQMQACAGHLIRKEDICGNAMLRSDLIFLQQRLLVRNDVESFLTEAFGRDGAVRVVLHGLPGIGKSTMARYFAYKNRGDVASLWIPASSNSEIIKSFEEYAKQICGENRDYSEPVSFVGQKLSKQCPGQWLVVFDGLDDPSISIERYLSALPASKLLFTTRHKDLASQIPGAYVLHVTPLDENTAEDLLNTYITSTPVSATTNKASQKELPVEEKGAKRRIVKELGGLPLAISIVGASMREDNGIPSMNCQAYLTWSDEAKDVLLDQDRQFSDYSSSVWKAFTFAFQKILSGTGGYQYTASMAYFTASCENASNLADYFRLYRKIKNKNPGRNRPLHSLRLAATDQIRFLENGLFELAIAELAAVNMITLNWTGGGPNSLPYIEMHSLVKRWLERSNYGQILTYTAPKMWLLGFGMYDQMVQNQVGLKEFEPLMKEIKASLDNGLDTLHKSCIPMLEIVFPFLLEAQKNLSRSIDHLPAGSDQRRHLRQFSKVLKSEIADSYDYNLEDIDWHSVFQDFVQEFEEQVECAVKSDAKSQEYMLKDFFLETLDSHGCIPIAFTSAAPYELSNVGQTSSIGDMGAEITAETESLLEKCLSQDSIKQAAEITHEGSHAAIRQWTERWDDDIKDIIGRCLSEVLIKRHCVTDSKGLVIDTSLPTNTAAEESSIGDVFRFITSSDSSNAFFAILRRAVKTATGQFLTSSPAIDVLNTQRDTFRDACESALRRGLGDRAQQFFWFQSLSSEAEDDTGFSLLWQLAWPARFPGGLEDLIAEQVVNSISNDLKKAAKTGFITAFEPHCQHWLSHGALNLAEDLAESVFEASGISNLFLNWIASGWVDLSDKEDDDSDDGVEPIYTQLIGEAQRYALDAMKAIYDNQAGAVTHDSVLQSLKRTFECRKELHDTVMGRLTQPNLTDQSGLGPFFAKMYFEDCDKNLRLAYSVLGNKVSTDDVATLDRLAGIETGWTFKKER